MPKFKITRFFALASDSQKRQIWESRFADSESEKENIAAKFWEMPDTQNVKIEKCNFPNILEIAKKESAAIVRAGSRPR